MNDKKFLSGLKEVGSQFSWWGIGMVVAYFLLTFLDPETDFGNLWVIILGCFVIDGTIRAFCQGYKKDE